MYEPNEFYSECLEFEFLIKNELTKDDNDLIQRFKPQHFNYLDALQKFIFYSIVDILCSYLYDLRVTKGEHCVESGWNILKLSPSLSFFVCWPNVSETLVGFMRRSLTYPFIRSWDLSWKILNDLKSLLKAGFIFNVLI